VTITTVTTDTVAARTGPAETPPPDRVPATAQRRGARARAHGARLLSVVGLGIVLLGWEVAVRGGLVSTTVMPTMSDTAGRLAELVSTGSFWPYLLATLRAWALGLLIASSIALPLGILLGLNDRAYRFVRLPLEAVRPVPPIVILPLALLAIGGGVTFQAVLIVQGALWPLLISVTYAIRETEPVALDTARSFHLGAWRTLAFVRLPSAAPLIGSGLRLAAATAFAVTLVSEILGGARGLGTMLMTAQSGGDVTTVYAVTIVAGLVGLGIATVFGLVERHLPGWSGSRS
jgi:ABC-type nitrate/sulfonate/bicarbonate transport system permease component